MEQSAAGVSGYVESLKRDRDRFVALAFCAADLLLEIGPDDTISYAAGATVSLLGREPDDIVGKHFTDLLVEGDRAMVCELIRTMIPGARLEPVPVRLIGARGPTVPLSLMGYHLPDLPGCHFFALRLGATPMLGANMDSLRRDSETGLLDRESFAEVAGKQISAAASRGETLELTMLDTGSLPALRRQMDEETSRSLMDNLGACLKAGAAGGHAAGRLSEDAFGFVHKAGFDVKPITARIEDIIRAADPNCTDFVVGVGTVRADITSISESDSVRVLLYTVNRFCEAGAKGFDMTSLGDNVERMTRETTERLNYFRTVVRRGDFQIALQPIVSLKDGAIHHFEALARFDERLDRSPYKLITFAEDTGIISDFDLAMSRRVIEWLIASNVRGERYIIAVNLSGRSIGNTGFVAALHDLLNRYPSMRKQIMFEITESSHIDDLSVANRFIQGLRRAGHQVCLDDFGAGSAALRYLHALEVDVVKIDGQYVRSASERPRNQAFLKAIVGLCHDLNIATVAEMVEDIPCARMLQNCGVQYGQGFMFGRPSFDISDFKSAPPPPKPVSALAARARSRTSRAH